jgi:hypothetical protein
MIGTIFALLILFQLKHFIADYPLQGNYMLGKFKPGWDFLGPLSAHCLVHAVMTFAITVWYTPVAVALGLAGLDFVIHFLMDRIKAGPKYLGRFKALNEFEWKAYTKKIDKAVEEEAIYDCYVAETVFNIRKQSNQFFWWSLGLDQMVHHLTHYLIILIIIIGYLA